MLALADQTAGANWLKFVSGNPWVHRLLQLVFNINTKGNFYSLWNGWEWDVRT